MDGLILLRVVIVSNAVINFYEDPTVAVRFEEHPYYKLLIHVDSFVWNKSVFNHYLDIWVEMTDYLKTEGHKEINAAIKPDDKKLKKFATLFGFFNTGVSVTTEKGTEREVYKCLI